MSRTIAFVRWRDAFHGNAEVDESSLQLVELHEVGFLHHESEESVTLVMENQPDDGTGRLWLTIPKVNIVEMVTTTVDRAFHKRRRASGHSPSTNSAGANGK